MTAFQGTILVLGATGQQGGAVAQQLATNGWTVRALVRDLARGDHRSDLAFNQPGIEVVRGDLDDLNSLNTAMKGTHGVFSVQPVSDPATEIRRGKLVADAAKQAEVAHVVYSSASGADRNTGIPPFEAKGEIERYLRLLDLPATILRPPMFMENFRFLLQEQHGQTTLLSMGGTLQTKMQMVAVHDIGAFAAIAFNYPATYQGKAIELAGDELTFAQITEVLGRFLGRPVAYHVVEQHTNVDGKRITEFFEREGFRADITALRQIHPQLLSLDAWLRQGNLHH
ncbi:hypothetical protein KSF_079320 [Reticulibacter mediterranei]|uniref:NmrA-like domain-containing protein n=1 Tax=Reticulibacter mediterranei TaxID=2778369 RepID=A0A8J3N4C6_9CHLR|nr:NmrA/HSCARG family protein [Reticulibacter mediterranei]GHO97884.1 hypothetical protein KSF_079320 [Reticulibacter mediterranei]